MDLKSLNRYQNSLWNQQDLSLVHFLDISRASGSFSRLYIFLPHQFFLYFALEDQQLYFVTVPFALSLAPQVVTKVLTPILALL